MLLRGAITLSPIAYVKKRNRKEKKRRGRKKRKRSPQRQRAGPDVQCLRIGIRKDRRCISPPLPSIPQWLKAAVRGKVGIAGDDQLCSKLTAAATTWRRVFCKARWLIQDPTAFLVWLVVVAIRFVVSACAERDLWVERAEA